MRGDLDVSRGERAEVSKCATIVSPRSQSVVSGGEILYFVVSGLPWANAWRSALTSRICCPGMVTSSESAIMFWLGDTTFARFTELQANAWSSRSFLTRRSIVSDVSVIESETAL